MNREKQIEEMAKFLTHCFLNCAACDKCRAWVYSKQLYDAGFRKQSEVAAEIFAEIQKHECSNLFGKTNLYMLTAEEFAELKKKYTEAKP